MRFSSLASVIPALVLLSACGTVPSTGTESGTGTGTDTDTSSSSSSTDPATTNNTTAGSCTPGQMVDCSCENGLSGAQTCNDAGTAYDPCVCTGATTTNTTDPTTSSATTDPTTGDVTATSTGPGSTTDQTSSGTTTSSTSGSSTGGSTGGSSTGGGGDAYGPCPGGDDAECQPGEICVTGMSMMGPWSFCTEGECQDNNECASDACTDAPGDGEPIDYCVPQICDQNNPCPDGMDCIPGFGMGTPAVCLWPA